MAFEVTHAVVSLLLGASANAYEATLLAAENDHGALFLVREQLVVGQDLLTAFFGVTAAELQLRKQVAGNSVYAIELRFLTAVRASVRVLLEPERLAAAANRLLAVLTFERILEHVIANAAD